MSISSALSTALTGLTASSRMAEVTASNISNALTEGYARRELTLSPRVLGQSGLGVSVGGVTRHVNLALLQDLRLSSASEGAASPIADVLGRIEQAYGVPDQPGSLSGRIARFEKSLLDAASRPDSDARLTAVADAANFLTDGLNAASDAVQSERQRADIAIASEVKRVNDALQGVADLNIRIRAFKSAGRDTSGLMDQRQQLIDSISTAIPLREVARDHDQVALYTSAGTNLLDGRPAKLEFSTTGTITADMTIGSGALSGLTINGQPVTTSPSGGRLGEGGLSALFGIRDDIAPRLQQQIDALARDLIGRVASPSVDPSLAPGASGLFTDGGGAFDPPDEAGLAGRISVNALVRPDMGGAVWRLRDGIGAAAPGSPGNGTLLSALSTALATARIPASGGFSPGQHTLSDLAGKVLSNTSVQRLQAETEASFAAARSDGLRSEMLRDGVDTDQEMQTLLLIEQAYAANAKVIQTVDGLLEIVLGL